MLWVDPFSVCAENPNIGKLSEEQRQHFEELLGTRVRVIYQHI